LPEVSSQRLTLGGIRLNSGDFRIYRDTPLQMEEPFLPGTGNTNPGDGTRDREMDALLRTYPGLDDLEPYCIEWEFIWPM